MTHSIRNKIRKVPPRMAIALSGIALLVLFFGKIAELPGIEHLIEVAPPYLPYPEPILAVVILILLWANSREANRRRLIARTLVVFSIAAVMTTIYLFSLGMLSVLPPEGRHGERRQIGFYMYSLTDKARNTIQELGAADPKKELATPNDLMNAFGVWGGAGRTDEIWPMSSIIAAAAVLHGLFLFMIGLWAYGLGALLKYLTSKDWSEEVLGSISITSGHFAYESGYHGNSWIDLNRLLSDATSARAWAVALARASRRLKPDMVCGPPPGGAFLAQQIASELEIEFLNIDRVERSGANVEYHIPDSLRQAPRAKRVLISADVINAATAVQAVFEAITACDGRVVGIACLIDLGEGASRIAREHNSRF